MTRNLARRQFLKLGALATAWAARPLRAHAQRPGETVIVVGAGLAGLAAAHRLRETGANVIVLEARAVPGGRVRTVRDPFDNGLYGELGAARIFDTHYYVMHWVNRYGLSLVPFAPAEGETLFVRGAMRVPSVDIVAGDDFIPDVHAHERGASPSVLFNRLLEGVPADLAIPEISPESLAQWEPLDAVTWPDFLRGRGASEDVVALLTLGSNSSAISALYVLRQIMLHRGARAYLKIEGGMDRLPTAMAGDLGDRIRYNCAVTAVAQDALGVRLTCRENGRETMVTGDRVVLTIAFSLLRDVGFDPPLSPQKAQIVENLPYRAVTRFLLQSRTRFWHADGLSGAARTDAPAELWDASAGQPGTQGILSVTTSGAPSVGSVPSVGESLEMGTGLAANAFPDITEQFQKGITQNWTADPWSKGAFAVFYPGQMTRWWPHLAAPEGRIHFAGEHVSPWPGWMEGALWSAERVLQEIL